MKVFNAQPSFMPAPAGIPAAFAPAPQGQAPPGKLVPFISYPGVAMWQFMPPASVDTSQDHVLRPPVAQLQLRRSGFKCNHFVITIDWIRSLAKSNLM